MKKKNLVLIVGWVVLSAVPGIVPAHGADTGPETESRSQLRDVGTPLTLQGAIDLAIQQNPELRAADARVNAAAGRALQARVWTNPELELNAEDWPVSHGKGLPDAKQTIGISQTFAYPGKKSLDGQIGTSDVRVSEAQLELRRLEITRDVKAAFYGVLTAERLVQVEEELVRVAEASASTAQKRVAAGAAPDQEQLRAEILLEQAKSELAGFTRESATARQTLAYVLGRPNATEVPVAGSLAERGNEALLAHRPEQWLTNHPAMIAARVNVERAELALRRARLEPYPDVRLGFAGGRLGETDESIIQMGVSVPLPILDRSKGKKREAQANVALAEAEMTIAEQRLLREWGTAAQRLRTATSQVQTYREKILPKAEEALRLVQRGFEEGKFGFIDLLDTQRTTAESRLAYQQKLLELNTAQAELELLASRPSESAHTPARTVKNK